MTQKKEWKKQSERERVERFKINPTFEKMLQQQREQPESVAALSAQNRLALHRYSELKKQAGK